MPIATTEIGKGMTLHVIPTDKFKSNFLSVNLVCPLKTETASLNALLPAVLSRGTEQLPTMAALNRALCDLYAASVAPRAIKRGDNQVIGFSMSFLDDSLIPDESHVFSGAVSFLEQLLFHPLLKNGLFDGDYVESEKKNLCDAIRAKINNKDAYAAQRLTEEMCRGEAYAIDENGTVDEVNRITPASLMAQYRQVLSTAPIEIFYIGKTAGRENEIEAVIRRMFDIPRGDVTKTVTDARRQASDEVSFVTEDMPIEQGKLVMGFRSGCSLSDAAYYQSVLFQTLYGSGQMATARLFMTVREKLSLCYYCYVVPEPLKGIMTVRSGVEVSKKEQAYDEILKQLKLIQAGEFSDAELDNSKRFLCSAYAVINDSPEQLESWYFLRLLAGIATSPEDASALIQSATRDDVVAAANAVSLDTVYFLNGTGGAKK